MARGACAPDSLRAWDGKEAFHVCTWGPGHGAGTPSEEADLREQGARGDQSAGGSQGWGGAVLLLSGQCPVSAFNCPRLSVAPAVHGRQPCTRPTPPPSACRALPGLQPVCSCSSHCVGGGGWGRGSERSVGGEARPTVSPRHQEPCV